LTAMAARRQQKPPPPGCRTCWASTWHRERQQVGGWVGG
jgi:hypothetical protein